MSFFSVIIPLFNKENYVENTLKSIISQTFTDYEVLIINDCSTDASVAKVTPFLSEKITLLHHTENKGPSATRNTGIKNVKSEYVAFLDADDLWKNTFLETIHRLIVNFPEAKIFGTNYNEVYINKSILPSNCSKRLPKNFEGHINFFELNLEQGIYNQSSVCFHRDVYSKVGFYNEKINFSEDIDFNIRANYHFKLAYSNSIQMSYLMQTENQSTTSSILNKHLPDFNQYEKWGENNSYLKKYLDFERYVLAKRLKMEENSMFSNKIRQDINLKNLNWKQKLLLISPVFVLKIISKIKLFLIRKGIKVSSY